MKRIIFICCLLMSLLCLPLTGFAAGTEKEYEEAVVENWKKVLKNEIALDTLSVENNTSFLSWLDAESSTSEIDKQIEKIRTLAEELAEKEESLKPYIQATKACEEKLNSDGANTALENILLIQEKMLKDANEIKELWKKVDEARAK